MHTKPCGAFAHSMGTKNWLMQIWLPLCLILGILYGASLVHQDAGRFAVFETGYWQTIRVFSASDHFAGAFWQTLQFGLLFWVLFFVLGLLAGGQVGTFFVLFCSGLGFGARLGSGYLQNGVLQGLLEMAPYLPGFVLVLCVLLLSAKESIRLQTALWRVLCGKQTALRLQAVKLYGCKQLLLLLLLFVAAMVSGVLVLAAR